MLYHNQLVKFYQFQLTVTFKMQGKTPPKETEIDKNHEIQLLNEE